ncbi:GAF domain-containing protein [Reichenbachiella carrageenanivorans]|uniref:GAF domain-containing protein n=1 Tax=Reichenbachiella carrageenanivorans TaxID=2979869 RepID=A0ABY6D2W5_9BACT|nr:GAF domain-containing protein [Reichenbachiella carrageenanivorans]UXX80496.1 GAF domain-containing protein [Reichenbachiella carrageenanivorans]
MAEHLFLTHSDNRQEKYEVLIPQIEALISTESDLTANLANVAAALKEGLGFFWVGFYLVKEGELVLGPFQGPIACTRIQKGKGVCGTAWAEKRTIIVKDVDQFPGHIACSSASQSEIVLPAYKGGEVTLILDVDSDQLADFKKVDQIQLEKLMKIIEAKL